MFSEVTGIVIRRRQGGAFGLLTAAMRLRGTLRVRPGAGRVLEGAAFGWRCSADVGERSESDALTVWSAKAGTSLAAAAVARRAFGTSLGGGGIRLGRDHQDGEER